MDDLSRRVAIRYRQKGKARKTRVKQYRRNKIKSKTQNRHWRMKHRQQVQRYRQKRERNPHMHELRRKSAGLLFDPAALLPIHFWNTRDDLPGQVRSVAIDGTFIDTFMGEDGAELQTYDIDDFLEVCIVLDEGAERTLFDVLDEVHGLDAEQEDEADLIDIEVVED